jgi:hypothetical protein
LSVEIINRPFSIDGPDPRPPGSTNIVQNSFARVEFTLARACTQLRENDVRMVGVKSRFNVNDRTLPTGTIPAVDLPATSCGGSQR